MSARTGAVVLALLLALPGARAAFAAAASAPAASAAAPTALLAQERQLAGAGDFSGAVTAARAAIARLESAPPASNAAGDALPYLYDDLARWQFRLQQTDAAVVAAADAMRAAEQRWGAKDARLSYFLQDQAYLSYAHGLCGDALTDYRRAYAVAADTGQHAETLALATPLGELLRTVGREAEARTLWQEAMSRASSTQESQPLHVALANAALDNFDLATARAEAGAAGIDLGADLTADTAARPDPTVVLLEARFLRASGQLADSAALLRTATAAHSPADASVQGLFSELAVTEGLLGHYAAAETLYRGLLANYAGFDTASFPVARAHYGLALVYRMLGDARQSEAHFETALTGFQSCTGGTDWRTANLLIERSRLRLDAGRTDEALADSERAGAIVQALPGDWRVLRAYAMAARSQAQAARGEIDASRRGMLAVIADLQAVRGPDAEDLAPGYVHLAELATRQGDARAARDYANRALALREHGGAVSLWGSGTALSLLAAADGGAGHWSDYAQDAQRFVAAADEYLGLVQGADELTQRELARSRPLFAWLLDPLARAQPAVIANAAAVLTELFQLPQLAVAGTAVRAEPGSAAHADAATRALVRERLTLSEQWQAQSAQLAEEMSGTRAATSDGSTRVAALLVATQNRLSAVDAALAARDPVLAEALRPRSVQLATVQSHLRSGEAILLQFVSGSYCHALLVRHDSVDYRAKRLGAAAVQHDVQRLRAALDLGGESATLAPFDYAASHELYDASLGLFAAELASVRELIVIPDDAFQNIPWSVFVSELPGAQGPVDIATVAFAGDRYALSVVPTLGAFLALRERHTGNETARQPFLGVGDPLLTQGTAADSVLNGLEPIPETRQEMLAMAHLLGADAGSVVAGAHATKQWVLTANLEPYRVISFATHGLIADDFAGLVQPALVLSPPVARSGTSSGSGSSVQDRLLQASDIVQLNVSADLVILSACNTGRLDGLGGATGLSSLARAFFGAGAQALLVSHWAVASEATQLLLTHAVGLMHDQPDLSKSEALRATLLWMHKGGAGALFSAPQYWAPFTLVGDLQPLSAARAADPVPATIEGSGAGHSGRIFR